MYVLFVLTVCQVLSSIDARRPYILVEALKRDLGSSDTEIGLITGPVFSLTYAVSAIPIAKLSDRRNRVVIIGLAMTIWGGFTALAGLTGRFGTSAITGVASASLR